MCVGGRGGDTRDDTTTQLCDQILSSVPRVRAWEEYG